MQIALPRLVVTGGCPLLCATLRRWLQADGFEVCESDPPDACDRTCICLVLCSEHEATGNRAPDVGRDHNARRIALLSCNCERALSVARSRGFPNVFCADEPPDRLAFAIQEVASGLGYQSETFQRFLERSGETGEAESSHGGGLTPRELDVLRLLAQGLSKKRIAETLHLSVKTVDNHCTSIMSKLNIHNRVDLARYAIREGLATA